MRLTLRVLGLDLLDFEVSTDSPSPEPDDDTARDLSGGTLASTPVGFVARYDRADDAELPERG